MSVIRNKFRELERKKEKALIIYLPVGYPSWDETVPLVNAACAAGADLVELGVPCSDPLADGPVIQEAAQVALQNGVTLKKCVEAARQIRDTGNETPIALMGYGNSFSAYGFSAFAEDAQRAGINGLIIPDLPPEMAGSWKEEAREKNLDFVFFLSPTSTEERIRTVSRMGSGFIYCIAVNGVTGERKGISGQLPRFLQTVKQQTDLPLAVGFGLSNAEHVREVSLHADGAIVGSALINRIKKTPEPDRADEVFHFISELKKGTKTLGIKV